MQHRNLTQACTRAVAGMFIGVLIAAAPGAFADEVSSFNQNASFSPSNPANSSSSSNSQTLSSNTDGGARSFLSGMAGKAGDVVVGALNMIGVRYRWAAIRLTPGWIAAVSCVMCSRTRWAWRCRAALRK